MKKSYQSPFAELTFLFANDFLTLSSDNDAPFVPPAGSDDDGWSGYH